MTKLSFLETRRLQKVIIKNLALSNKSTSFLEKRKAQKKVIEAKIKLGIDLSTPNKPSKPSKPDESIENESTDNFGVKKGTGATGREKLNKKAKDILAKLDGENTPSQEDIEILKQYSGRGGLKEGSQYEYFTPVYIASGMWGTLKAHGLENGNILEPSAGSGVFGATKPSGAIITGAEIDKTSSTINTILHPEDTILNQSFEELVTSDANADVVYDSVIGNVPFGDQRGSYARKDPAYKNEKQIERYFIHRSIDKVRAGGLVVLVIPTNVISSKGKAWVKFRGDISSKAEFLGAHKLPSKTFGRQGTNTVTDIIILKKHSEELLEKIDELPVDKLKESNVLWSEFIQGDYWKGEGKKFIHGKFIPKDKSNRWSREEVVPADGLTDKGLQGKLAKQFKSRIKWRMLDSLSATTRSYAQGDIKIINGSQFTFNNGSWEKVSIDESEIEINPTDFGASSIEELKGKLQSSAGVLELGFNNIKKAKEVLGDSIIPNDLLDAFFFASRQKMELQEHAFRGSVVGSRINAMLNNATSTNEDERITLSNLLKDDFSTKGHSSKQNKGIILSGSGAKDYGAYDAAIDKDGNLSDLIKGELDTSKADGFNENDPVSIVSHLFNSELEPISIDEINKHYKGSLFKTVADLAKIDGLAIDPSGGIYPLDIYCSGDYVPRLQAMNDAIATEKDSRLIEKYKSQISRIESKRIKTPTSDITFGLRHKWLDPKYAKEFLENSGYKSIEMNEDGEWDYPRSYSGGGKPWGLELRLLRYIQGRKITGDSDMKATEYRDKIKTIEDQFNNFIKTHPDSIKITEEFNLTLNSYIPFEYSKASLNLKGKAKNIEPHDYQNQAVRQLSDKGRGILGDGVGLGKTIEALTLHQYDKEKGRGKRTCITVPVSVLQNWYNESKEFFATMDDVLFVGFEPKRDKSGGVITEPVLDEEGKGRINKYTDEAVIQDVLKKDGAALIKQKLRSIPQSNYSLVVMPSTRFEEIPLKEETVANHTAEWVGRGLMNAPKKSGYTGDKKREQLKGQFSDTGKTKDDGLPYFEDMGFDKVIVDEGHYFKNSFKPGTEASRIANIPATATSKRAVDMAMKMGVVRDANGGRGSYMLTATPFTNSPVEIFNMMAMTMPMGEFEKMGVYSTDDFIKQFGKTEIKPRVTMSGDIVESEMLTGFQNLQGLRGIFYRYAVVRDSDDVKKSIVVPPHSNINDESELSIEQEGIYDELREEAQSEIEKMLSQESGDDGNLNDNKDDERRHMFSILRDMERVTTDLDLYYRTMTLNFSKKDKSKVEGIINHLPPSKRVRQPNPEGGFEHIDVSLTYEITTKGKVTSLVVPDSYEDDVIKAITKVGIDITKVSHPITPKYAKLIANLKSEMIAGGKQLIFTEEKTQHKKLARLIIYYLQIKPNQISIINADTASGEKLQKIADGYNSGKQLFVIANKKAEVGVNLQKGTTAIHHMTFPWTPSSLEQRNGRGVRQGNTASHINIYYYIAKRSIDTLRLDRIKGKDNWIKKMVHGESADLEYKDENTLSNDDYLYLFSKNPEEAKARLKIEEAKAIEKHKQKQSKNMVIAFAQYAEARNFVDNFEAILSSKKERIEVEIKATEASITSGERLYGDRNRQVIESKSDLQSLRRRSVLIEARLKKELVTSQNFVKQQKSLLEGKKDSLPFDYGLIANPTAAVLTRNSDLLEEGKTYEIPAKKEYYRTINPIVFRVESVDFSNKKIEASIIVADTDNDTPFGYGNKLDHKGNYTVSAMELGKVVAVNYNADDIDVKKLQLAKNLELEDIAKYSKEFFDREKDTIETKIISSDYFIVENPAKEYEVMPSKYSGGDESRIDSGYSLSYPDKNNEEQKTQVAKQYLVEKRKGYVYWDDNVMPVLFGSDWINNIDQYKSKASKEDALDALEKYYNAKAKAGEDVTPLDNVMMIAKSNWSKTPYIRADVFRSITKKGGWDNLKEIEAWFNTYVASKYQKAKEEQDRIEKEEARAAELKTEEAKKEEVNNAKEQGVYKEIPLEVTQSLLKIDIEIRYPTKEIKFKSGRASYTLDPYIDILLQDKSSNPYAGVLFKKKDLLKSNFDMLFTKDIHDDNFGGAWWIVDGGADPEEIKKLLSPNEEELVEMKETKKTNIDTPRKLLVPTSLGVGDKIPDRKWVIKGVSKSSWSANYRSLATDEDQEVEFGIETGDEVHYAYFN